MNYKLLAYHQLNQFWGGRLRLNLHHHAFYCNKIQMTYWYRQKKMNEIELEPEIDTHTHKTQYVTVI